MGRTKRSYHVRKRTRRARLSRLTRQRKIALAAGLSEDEFIRQTNGKKNSVSIRSQGYLYCPQMNKIIKNSCCRICLQEIHDCDQTYNPAEFIHKLLEFSPEMNLSIMPDLKICSKCCTALNAAYDFKILCHEAEKKLRSCIRVSPVPESEECSELKHVKQEQSDRVVEGKSEFCVNEEYLPRRPYEIGVNLTPNNVEIDVKNESCINTPESIFTMGIKEELVDSQED